MTESKTIPEPSDGRCCENGMFDETHQCMKSCPPQTTKMSDADYVREFKSQKEMETITEIREKNERLERIAQALEGVIC